MSCSQYVFKKIRSYLEDHAYTVAVQLMAFISKLPDCQKKTDFWLERYLVSSNNASLPNSLPAMYSKKSKDNGLFFLDNFMYDI